MIRIIGCGAMGSAIAHILAENGTRVVLYDKYRDRAEALAKKISAPVCNSALEGDGADDMLLLAFKPQDLRASIEALQDFRGKLIISTLAGVTTHQLKEAFPRASTMRMIPNLAVRYG